MTAKITPADTAPTTSAAPVARQAAVPAPPSWAWMRGALILAGAAAGIAHTGAFYLPALVVLAVGVAGLWRERG